MKHQNEIYEDKIWTGYSFYEIWSIFWKFSKIYYYHEFHFDNIHITFIMIYDNTTIVWNIKMKFMKRKYGPVIGFSDFDQFFRIFRNFPKHAYTTDSPLNHFLVPLFYLFSYYILNLLWYMKVLYISLKVVMNFMKRKNGPTLAFCKFDQFCYNFFHYHSCTFCVSYYHNHCAYMIMI